MPSHILILFNAVDEAIRKIIMHFITNVKYYTYIRYATRQ